MRGARTDEKEEKNGDRVVGAEKKGAPVRESLRRVGDAIRMAESKSSKG